MFPGFGVHWIGVIVGDVVSCVVKLSCAVVGLLLVSFAVHIMLYVPGCVVCVYVMLHVFVVVVPVHWVVCSVFVAFGVVMFALIVSIA